MPHDQDPAEGRGESFAVIPEWLQMGCLHPDAVHAIMYWRMGKSWATSPHALAAHLLENAQSIWRAYNAVPKKRASTLPFVNIEAMTLGYASALRRELNF